MAVNVQVQSEEYFNNLNTLAQKIATDIKHTQEAYQDLWQTLSKQDQDQVIDESIINPAAILKYARIQVPAIKGNTSTYSWFTKSQLDLCSRFTSTDGIADRSCGMKKPVHKLPTAAKEMESVEELANECKNESITEIKQVPSATSKSQTVVGQKSSVLKPKTPPPPPPSRVSVTLPNANGFTEASNDIPKSGFDFLDNW